MGDLDHDTHLYLLRGNLLDSLRKLDFRMKQWTKHKWNAEYLESISRVHTFIPRVSLRPLGMNLPKPSWVRLNHRPCVNGVSLHHRIANVAPLSKLQITSYLHVSYTMHQEEHEVCRFWMMQLNAGLTPQLPASNLGSTTARGGKRIPSALALICAGPD